MNQSLAKPKLVDWEEFGFQTTLACRDENHAKSICGLQLYAYADQLQPELSRLDSEVQRNRNHATALHDHLYDRPIPVNDAAMLTHLLRVRVLLFLSVLTAAACFAGNITTFYLLGWGLIATFLAAAGMTAFPLGLGHLAFEKIVAGNKELQIAVIAVAAVLGFGGLYQLAEARRTVVDKAATQSVTSSYVDGATPEDLAEEPKQQDGTEARIHGTLGGAALMMTIAGEIVLGLLVGLLAKMHTDEDYAAWLKLKKIGELVMTLQERASELLSWIEISKKHCMAGILRAQSTRSKRRVPYHQVLTVFVLFAVFRVSASHAQNVEHYEGILIDTSGSISKGSMTRDLFEEYLLSTKKLLSTEPANSRVWVSSIASDSFGGVRDVVKGWTPDARGIFTDDLNRARRQIATSFGAKSSGMAPTASGTDIFGGLWHFKALFESVPHSGSPNGVPRTIWIFSDMMNETPEFPMPQLLEMGPERMLERAKANGLLVSLKGYKIYVYGVSPVGLTPHSWMIVKRFWEMYFSAASAELVTYSTECDVQR